LRGVLKVCASVALAGCSGFRGLPADGGDASPAPIACPEGQSGAHRGVIASTRQLQAVDYATRATLDFHLKSATVDRQGRVLMAGGIRGCLEAGRFAAGVLRLTSNLEVDPTFGGTGRACIAPTVAGITDGTAYAVTVDESDRVVIAGLTNNAQGATRGLLARWTSNGRLDPTFGTNGIVDYRPGLNAMSPGFSVVFQSVLVDRGRILAAGSTTQPFTRGAAGLLARFTEDGSVDADFHGGAIYSDATMAGFYGLAASRGGYLVAGSTNVGTRVRVLRLDERGALDPAFAVGGALEHPRGRDVNVRSLGVDGAGRIYVGGGRSAEYSDVSSTAVVVRLSPEGAPDLAYGDRGEAVLSELVWGFAYVFDRAMMVRCDGTVFVAANRGARGAVGALDPSGRRTLEFGLEGAVGLPAPFELANCGAGHLWPAATTGSNGVLGGCSSNQHQTFLELRP
jgi:uncharacterized delta-60 repeat protein